MFFPGLSHCSFKLTFYKSVGIKICCLCKAKLEVQRIAKLKSFCKCSQIFVSFDFMSSAKKKFLLGSFPGLYETKGKRYRVTCTSAKQTAFP